MQIQRLRLATFLVMLSISTSSFGAARRLRATKVGANCNALVAAISSLPNGLMGHDAHLQFITGELEKGTPAPRQRRTRTAPTATTPLTEFPPTVDEITAANSARFGAPPFASPPYNPEPEVAATHHNPVVSNPVTSPKIIPAGRILINEVLPGTARGAEAPIGTHAVQSLDDYIRDAITRPTGDGRPVYTFNRQTLVFLAANDDYHFYVISRQSNASAEAKRILRDHSSWNLVSIDHIDFSLHLTSDRLIERVTLWPSKPDSAPPSPKLLGALHRTENSPNKFNQALAFLYYLQRRFDTQLKVDVDFVEMLTPMP